MKRKWKWIIGGAAVAAVLGMIISQSLKPLKLELLQIEKRTIARYFTEEGLVVSGTDYPVSTVTGGKVVRLPVIEGQKVEKGAILIEFDSTDLEFQKQQLQAQLKSISGEEKKVLRDTYPAELARQKAALEQAKRNLQSAQNNFDRIKSLYDAGAVSTVDFETADKALKDAQNTVTSETAALDSLVSQHKPTGGTAEYYSGQKESLESQLERIDYQIEQCTLRAPSRGIVAQVSVKEGETITPGSQMMTLLREGTFKVEVFVLTEDVEDLRLGMEVSLIQDKVDQDISFSGTISAIAPAAVEKTSALGLEEQRVKVTVLPKIPGGMILRSGYHLDVKFQTAEEKGRLVVPKTAVFTYKNKDALWVVRKGKASIQSIDTGFENETELAVTKGLKEGDLVILDAQAEGLKEGKRIKATAIAEVN